MELYSGRVVAQAVSPSHSKLGTYVKEMFKIHHY